MQNNAYKQFKDPVYGYIDVPIQLVHDFIDSACFQRLNRIGQTSYTPLYHAALHNRFGHSLGVYHLGKLAFSSLKKDAIKRFEKECGELDWDELEQTFELACLLHDVGHAPFSHSGEGYYLTTGGLNDPLYDKLKIVVSDETYAEDADYYLKNSKSAAPHEIMSVIVAIETFKDFFDDNKRRVLLARCITGYKYQNPTDFQSYIENILIELLNSPIIDVDKLDYLIRDSYVTGYKNTSLDYPRLLGSISICEIQGKYELVFNKSALSVLENVIYAHDSEKKWIQSHPAILYGQFLVNYIIKHVNSCMQNNKETARTDGLICLDAIGKKGRTFQGINISYLCDDDIIFLAKNLCADELTNEYFERSRWRHPIWKSESEFKSITRMIGDDARDKMNEYLKVINEYLAERDRPVLDDDTIADFERDLESLKNTNDPKLKKDLEWKIKLYTQVFSFMKEIRTFFTESDMQFDLVVIKANDFTSGFQKEELLNIKIYFPGLDKADKLKDVLTLLSSNDESPDMYYIYYRSMNTDGELKRMHPSKFVKHLKKILT